MRNLKTISRREAIKIVTLSAIGLPWLYPSRSSAEIIPNSAAKNFFPLKLGVASYSLAKFSPENVISTLKWLRIQYISLYKTHCPWDGAAEDCRKAAAKFTDSGLVITGSGVIELPNDEAKLRKSFENARAAGLPTMVCKPATDALPLVEKFVKEFDIKLAIHNHGPEDKVYPSPYVAWEAVQPYDERIGLCIDVGHAARSGVDPVEAIRKCHSRLYDLHLKDSTAAVGALKDEPVEVGRGKLDIKGILAALIEVKYQHIVAFEYEKRDTNPFPGLNESVQFVRKAMVELSR